MTSRRAMNNNTTINTTVAPPRHRSRPATCGRGQSSERTPKRDTSCTSTGRQEGWEEWTRHAPLDVNGLRVSAASAERRQGRARPCSAGTLPSTRNSSISAGERRESAWEGSQFTSAEQRSLESDREGWVETWISSALQAKQRPTKDEAFPSNETDDDEWSKADMDACHPLTEEIHPTGSPCRSAVHSPRHQCSRTDELRVSSRRRSFRRPQTASAYTGHSALRLRCDTVDSTHQRPQSAGGVGMKRWDTFHWPGTGLTVIPGLAVHLSPPRSSVCEVKVTGASKRGVRRGVRAGGAGGRGHKVPRGCCRPQVEATWSYRASKRADQREPPRQILVKVPCVRSNGKGRRENASYKLAWNSDIRRDGRDGDIDGTGENAGEKHLKAVNGKREGMVADAVCDGTSIPRNTMSVVQLPRPLPRQASLTARNEKRDAFFGAPSAGINSSLPQANAEDTPRRSCVIARSRSSVACQRRQTTSKADAAETTAFSPHFSCESQGRSYDRMSNAPPPPADNRGGRTSTTRPRSAVSTRTPCLDYRLRRECVGTREGVVGSLELKSDTSETKRRSSWARATEASGNAHAWRPRTAGSTTVSDRKGREARTGRRERARTGYSFFPSPRVEGRGVCIFVKRNGSMSPFGVGEINGSVSEWERSMCSTTDDVRSGFGFDLDSPERPREPVDCS